MPAILDSRMHRNSGARLLFGVWAFASLFFATRASAYGQQTSTSSAVTITPSSASMLVTESASFSIVDSSGSPIRETEWTIRPPIADLTVEHGEVTVRALREGRAMLTGSTEYGAATATISIIPGSRFSAGTVRWTLEPTPDHESLITVQSVPSASGLVFYSVEWSRTSNAVVRALTEGGEELWRSQLNATANPADLKMQLAPVGLTMMNNQTVSDHTQLLIGDNNTFFAASNPRDPSHYGLLADGKYALIRICGANSGGIYLLERGRFRDLIVKLDPASGKENWEYRSEGHLTNSWTVNSNDDIGIVETISKAPFASFVIVDGTTGSAKFRMPFPTSSSTLTGVRCSDPVQNVLSNVRPSVSGSPFTNTDGNMYLQVEVHVESVDYKACKPEQYSFDERLLLLRVTPAGEPEWKTFQHIHADGVGGFAVQDRLFAGETIPDGFGGFLAAWTYVDAHTKPHEPMHTEARISRISESDQRDFTLPMPFWTPGLNSFFDEAMVLGDDNILFATNGMVLVRFNTQTGLADWVRRPPTGQIALDHATAGGGVLVFNSSRLAFFNAKGDGLLFPWAATTENPDDIGVAQFDVFDHTPEAPIVLRKAYFYSPEGYLGVEEGAPRGHGSLVFFSIKQDLPW